MRFESAKDVELQQLVALDRGLYAREVGVDLVLVKELWVVQNLEVELKQLVALDHTLADIQNPPPAPFQKLLFPKPLPLPSMPGPPAHRWATPKTRT